MRKSGVAAYSAMLPFVGLAGEPWLPTLGGHS